MKPLPTEMTKEDASAILDLCRVEVGSAQSLLMIGEKDHAFKIMRTLYEDLVRIHPLVGQEHNVSATVEKFGLESGKL